jgi:hypothetical protein
MMLEGMDHPQVECMLGKPSTCIGRVGHILAELVEVAEMDEMGELGESSLQGWNPSS